MAGMTVVVSDVSHSDVIPAEAGIHCGQRIPKLKILRSIPMNVLPDAPPVSGRTP